MNRAFTVIEILVVLTVIAVVVALSVPAISIMRARAQATQCVANLRGLGVGLNVFLADNKMTMPDLAAARRSRAEDIPVIDNTLDRYVDDARVFACPSDRKLAAETGASYYWNSALSGQAVASLNMFGLVSDLSRIPVLVDKEGWHDFSADKVNHLFADGHASKELRLFTE